MGYTPLFDSLTTGTLCGRWPDIGLWAVLLSMADRNGVIDVTPDYIARVTGLEIREVLACLDRFCAVDDSSRSSDAMGARLVKIDELRLWGWRIVNHAKYRERARLMSKNEREVASGANAARMAQTAVHRRSPPETAADRPSYSDINKDKNKSMVESPSAFDRFWALYPKKVKKKPAHDIWKRKRLDPLAEQICSDVAKRPATDAWKRGFVPDPTSYLQQERWNDEGIEEVRRWE